ncbi:MAG: DUF4270 domain-containing protein [Mediterranea massiliensis]|nr:DUF4270 domain-containing protein [Mediterranea massiliensis]
MKRMKYLGTLICTLLLLIGCDDNTGSLGIDMLPDTDGLITKTKIYEVSTRSVAVDSVYAKTSTGYVGKFTDPEFGYYESSFLTELNCTENFRFPAVYKYDEATKTGSGNMAGDSIVSTALVVYYSTWFGDSLNACRMSVYELDKRLEKNRYTNINPELYYDKYNPDALIGRKAYSAFDTSVPDSIRYETDAYGDYTYYPNITFNMDKEFGNEILRLNREHPEYFKNADTFIDNIFKGIYVKSDMGDGTILYIDRVDMKMMLCQHYVDTLGVALKCKDGTDSLSYAYYTVFSSTKEVIQANQFLNSDIIAERVAEEGHTYLKSPVGIFTEATMPYDQIHKELEGDTLNSVKMTFTNYNQESNYEFSMDAPTDVLLIRKNEVKDFFENNKLPDNITSYTATHNAVATNQYTFSNISRLVTACINEKNEAKKKAGSSWNEEQWIAENPDWDKVLLMPVVLQYETTGNYNQTMTGIQNDLKPSYAKLLGGPKGTNLDIEVTYTIFDEAQKIAAKDYSNYKEDIPQHIRERMNLKK